MVWILGCGYHPALESAMVRFGISRLGVFLAAAFFAYSVYFLIPIVGGSPPAPIFISLVTLPFSIGINVICDRLQDAMHLSNQQAYVFEIVTTCLFGIVEFYAIGCVIDYFRRYKHESQVD